MAALQARSVLLTGSNRGIGLELVRQLLGGPHPPTHIFATCRDPEGPRGKVSMRVGDGAGGLRGGSRGGEGGGMVMRVWGCRAVLRAGLEATGVRMRPLYHPRSAVEQTQGREHLSAVTPHCPLDVGVRGGWAAGGGGMHAAITSC